MKHFRHLLVMLLLLASWSLLSAQSVPPDKDAIIKLTGDWTVPAGQHRYVTSGEFHFKSDGTFTSFMVFKFPSGEQRFEVEGKWKIEKGILIEEITKSNDPKKVPIGLLSRDTLINLTDKEYRFKDERNDEAYRTRQPEKA